MTHDNITIRFSRPRDARAVARLSQLDSARYPRGRLLVAEVAGELCAALPIDGGAAIADPFRQTNDLVELLEAHRRQALDADGGLDGRPWGRLAAGCGDSRGGERKAGRSLMAKRALTRWGLVFGVGVCLAPASAAAQTNYTFQVEAPSSPARSAFPYVGVAGPGNLTGAPIQLAAGAFDRRQQWRAMCERFPGDCDYTGGPDIGPEFYPGKPPVKLYHPFSGLCLTRPNDSGNGTRPVLARCTKSAPTHQRQWWYKLVRDRRQPSGYRAVVGMPDNVYLADRYWYRRDPGARCLDVTGFSNVPGTSIQLWSCTGAWNQRFKPGIVVDRRRRR